MNYVIIYSIFITLLLFYCLINMKNYGSIKYRDGVNYAKFNGLMPDEKVIGVFCADGILYVYDSKMKKYIRKVNDASLIMKEVYEEGVQDGLDFGWGNNYEDS